MIKFLKYWYLIALTALLFYAGCSGKNGEAKEKDRNNSSIPVEISLVSSGDISTYFTGTATIEAEEETDVVARVGGVVRELMVEEGDYVDRNDILARLDDEEFRVRLNQAGASLNRMKVLYERNLELHRKGLISTEEFQQSKYDYKQQEAAYEMAELNLKHTAIRTPISGVVSRRMVKVGNMVLQNSPAFRVTGLNPLIAVLHVPEKRLESLSEGQEVKLRIDALGGEFVRGRIKRISPVVDPETGTVKVTVETINSSDRLKPGMFAEASIILRQRDDATTIPLAALVDKEGRQVAFVVEQEVVRAVTPDIAFIQGGRAVVESGIAEGDLLVVIGQQSLSGGDAVTVAEVKE